LEITRGSDLNPYGKRVREFFQKKRRNPLLLLALGNIFCLFPIMSNIKTIIQTGKFSWLNEMETPFMDILKPCLDIIDRIVSQPFVFGHWDMAPEENLVIGREGEEPIYYFIDWDEIYFGPALDNLPIIRFDETEELALVERYWECVRGSTFVPSEKDECFLMYNYCRLMRYICDVYRLSKRLIQTQFGDIGAAERIRQSISNAITLAKKLQIIPSY